MDLIKNASALKKYRIRYSVLMCGHIAIKIIRYEKCNKIWFRPRILSIINWMIFPLGSALGGRKANTCSTFSPT